MPARLAWVYVGPMCGTVCPDWSLGAARVVRGVCPGDSKKRFNLRCSPCPVKSRLAEVGRSHDLGSLCIPLEPSCHVRIRTPGQAAARPLQSPLGSAGRGPAPVAQPIAV